MRPRRLGRAALLATVAVLVAVAVAVGAWIVTSGRDATPAGRASATSKTSPAPTAGSAAIPPAGDDRIDRQRAAEPPPPGATADQVDALRSEGAAFARVAAAVPDAANEPTAVVASTSGAPIHAAELAWTPVGPVLLASVWDWDELDLAWWDEVTSRASSDEHGAVAPEPPPLDGELGSVVWTDADGFEARVDVLEPGEHSLGGRRFELERAAGVRVLVVDAHDEPVEAAVVVQAGVELGGASSAPGYVAHLYRRARTTGADGAVVVPRFPGTQALVARGGSRVSRPIRVPRDVDTVTLTLRDAFPLAGTVTRPSGPGISGEIVPRITVLATDGYLERELATAVARLDGTFGPVDVPLVPIDSRSDGAGETRYRVLVHGVAVVPYHRAIATPSPGERVTLHLDAEVGLIQWFRAMDVETGQPLLGTRVTVSWEDEGGRIELTRPARGDGYIEVLGIRPGIVHAKIEKPGYVPGVVGTLELPAAVPVTHQVEMEPAATVSGHVLRAGEPVRDFDVTSWPSQADALSTTESFRDRDDGAFAITAWRNETVALVASAPGSPGSAPLQVQVGDQDLSGIELELVDAVVGTGRVVASDGTPRPDAIVQPHVSGGGRALVPYGPALELGADGEFRATAFRDGINHLTVRAPGRATRTAVAHSEGGRVDFGVIALDGASHLRVELPGAPDGFYTLRANGDVPRSTRDFERDESGALVATLADIPSGRTDLEVTHPNGRLSSRVVRIEPGPNVVRFPPGDGALVVEVDAATDAQLILFVVLRDHDDEWESTSIPVPDDRVARIDGVPSGTVRIYLVSYAQTLASKVVTVLPGRETPVELVAGDAEVTVRVVDAGGDPVPGAKVRLHGSERVAETRSTITDERGIGRLGALARGRFHLQARHPTLGISASRELDFTGDEPHEVELELDGRAALELQLVDGDVPVVGAVCRLVDRRGRAITGDLRSSDEGRATFPRLSPGSYRLQVSGSAVWPLEIDLDAQPGAGLRTLAVRRLGDLRLRILSAGGPPIAGAAVRLTDAATGEDVAGWLAAGRVDGPAELVSDLHGEIVLRGLPRGAYLWVLGDAQGMVTVAPGDETLALLSPEG